jgi:hypothetical protein
MLFIVSPEEVTSCGGYKWTQREKWIRDICDILRGWSGRRGLVEFGALLLA